MRAHFILFVADQAAATAFYRAVLARAPRLEVPGMTEYGLSAGAVLGLMPEAGIRRLLPDLPDPASVRGAPRGELYLLVDDPEAHLERLVAAGGRLLDPVRPRDWGHRAGYGLDLDGHLVVFAA
ncbi:MAG: glyoxalase [Deltaproteobacteria bacterium HGW-Deltaproteobacteria-14]|jgi:catechol 2,3-dioxygenase-like lactoylglutathione lyase family enzyme|nr:MAG: glyoxalase [Deltaproteobacteria bacterium HGW-Deltaproteobacteria-14]